MKTETNRQAVGYRFFRVQYVLAAAILYWAWQSSGSAWPNTRPATLAFPFLSGRGLLVLLSIGVVLTVYLWRRAPRTQCSPAFHPPPDIPIRDRSPCGPTEQAVLLLDSNIWMNAALDGFFSMLKRQLLQRREHVTLFGPQFDEICNLKDRQPYSSRQGRLARLALARIEALQLCGCLIVDSLTLRATPKVFADPLILKFIQELTRAGRPVTLVTDDRELRIRARRLGAAGRLVVARSDEFVSARKRSLSPIRSNCKTGHVPESHPFEYM